MKKDYAARFESAVDLLRATGTYTAVLDSGNIYLISSVGESLPSINEYIKLEGVAVRVTEVVDATTFKIDNTSGQAISLTGGWKSMSPYSIIGTRKTVNMMMLQRNSYEYQYQKYPMIALRLPFTLQTRNGMRTFQANILIATFTSKVQTPDQRLVNTFRPILYPLRDRFLEMVVKSGEFLGFDKDYDEIDRMFYGIESGDETNIKNVFADPLDAIEIKNLNLKYLDDECTRFPMTASPGFEYILENSFES